MTSRIRRSIASTLALGLAACASPRPADVVVYASGTDLESANPLVTIHPLSRQVQRHVLYATLVRYDSALNPVPYFARSWTWSRGATVLDVELDSTLEWHDGRPSTAADVVFTLLAARDPRFGYARASELADIDTVFAVSPTLVRLRFTSPQRGVPPLFAELPVMPRHILGDVQPADMRRAAFNLSPVGNGPFRFVDRVAGQRWTFQRNDRFPDAMGGPPLIRQLVIAVVDEPTTKFAGLASGDLDVAGIAPTMAELAERDPLIDVVSYPVLFSTGIVFNLHRAPFDDVRVRRAVHLSIDRRRIVDAALAGYATVAAGPVPPENPMALKATALQSPGVADSLLDEAGFPRGSDGWRRLNVQLLTVGSGDNATEQLIQADLAERGIRMEIRQLELAAFLARARAEPKDFDMLITGVPGDLALSYLRSMFATDARGSSLDYADFHTPALDALFGRVRSSRSSAELRSAWLAVQLELERHVPVSWLYHSRGLQGVSERLAGVTMDLRGELVTVSRWSVGRGTGEATSSSVAGAP
jgi:peptide/nickel transport system substrate-binding protein